MSEQPHQSNAGAPLGGTPGRQDSTPAVRASDDERHRMAELLGEHASVGRLTLAELEERVARAYAATTRAELAELTTDLPDLTEPAPDPARPAEPAERRRSASRWFVAILGGSKRRGRRRLSGQVNVVAVLGGDDIDLREAEIDGNELVMNVFSVLGGPSIYLPDSVELELSGPAILGGNDERGSSRPARPGAPVVRIRSFALLGGADVWRLPAETRGSSLKEARRAAKALERGEDD